MGTAQLRDIDLQTGRPKENNSRWAVNGLIALTGLALLSIYDMTTTTRNLKWERDVVVKLTTAKSDGGAKRFTLATVDGRDFDLLCRQAPYQSQQGFEAATGRTAKGFETIGDSSHRWWVFFASGAPAWIDIPYSVMGPPDDDRPACRKGPISVAVVLQQDRFGSRYVYRLDELAP